MFSILQRCDVKRQSVTHVTYEAESTEVTHSEASPHDFQAHSDRRMVHRRYLQLIIEDHNRKVKSSGLFHSVQR